MAGCKADGVNEFRIAIPAVGSTGKGNSLYGYLGLVICNEHRKTTKPADFLSDDGKAAIAESLKAQGKAPPDFARATLEWKDGKP